LIQPDFANNEPTGNTSKEAGRAGRDARGGSSR